jgi:hypothetical protein
MKYFIFKIYSKRITKKGQLAIAIAKTKILFLFSLYLMSKVLYSMMSSSLNLPGLTCVSFSALFCQALVRI